MNGLSHMLYCPSSPNLNDLDNTSYSPGDKWVSKISNQKT